MSIEERFWPKVDVRGPDECWPWLASKQSAGYGQIAVGRGHAPLLAHRVAYELVVGPIPAGLTIDHVKARGCTRKDCVNPAHLEPVTQRENVLRSDNACAVNARKTHCHRGHEFTVENTTLRGGTRACRICEKARWARNNAKRRAAA